jgi:hypothetical protein
MQPRARERRLSVRFPGLRAIVPFTTRQRPERDALSNR